MFSWTRTEVDSSAKTNKKNPSTKLLTTYTQQLVIKFIDKNEGRMKQPTESIKRSSLQAH